MSTNAKKKKNSILADTFTDTAVNTHALQKPGFGGSSAKTWYSSAFWMAAPNHLQLTGCVAAPIYCSSMESEPRAMRHK